MPFASFMAIYAAAVGQLAVLPVSAKLALGITGSAAYVWLAFATARQHEKTFRLRIHRSNSSDSPFEPGTWWPLVLLDASNFAPEGRSARRRLMLLLSAWSLVTMLDVALLALLFG